MTRRALRIAVAEKMLVGDPPLCLVYFDDFRIDSLQERTVSLEAIKEKNAEHVIESDPMGPFSKKLSILCEWDMGMIAY